MPEYLNKNQCDVFTNDELSFETCLFNIICSTYSENILESITKMPIKNSRLRFLYELYFSYFTRGFIDLNQLPTINQKISNSKFTIKDLNEKNNIETKDQRLSRFSVTSKINLHRNQTKFQSISSKAFSFKNQTSIAQISERNDFDSISTKCPVKLLKSFEV